MSVPDSQRETASLLQSLAGSAPIETHISLVFLGHDTVWKLKKAVRLSFLDFTRVEDRRRFAKRELALNAAAAAGLYRDVVAVVRRPDGTLALEPGATSAVDWVLRMARVPAGDFLDVMAAEGKLGPTQQDALADAVFVYHAALPPAEGVLPPIRDVALGNTRAALAAGLPEREITAWQTAISGHIDRLTPWMTQRARDGFVRRAHGDLHLGNICLWEGRPVPFDALEFDESLATIDLGYDLAFLLMDLDRRVNRAAANRVLNRTIARGGDVGLLRGLPVFLSLRSMIRAHVEARSGHAGPAAGYLAAAGTYLAPPPPTLLAIGGLPGTGKSTLARSLAPDLGAAPGAVILRSDEIRKRRYGVAPEQPLPPEAYADDVNSAVFETLLAAAGEAIASGHAVIADATFLDPLYRARLADVAAAHHVPFHGFWLQTPLPLLEARVAARRGDASDASVEVLRAAARHDPGAGHWHAIDATNAGSALCAVHAAFAGTPA
jgi:aminoglycoside phosphotransferase family enzyme/predicted kinase